ncbi:MAG: hypothetical protein FWC47_17605 [Oscillospiraceae bacterium]|nr:hypothetical protein [Oscillospiraceae bacterium]
MRRWKDFKHLDIYNLHEKKIGFSSDIIIDFYKWEVTGITMSNISFFSKKNGFMIKCISKADFENEKIIVQDIEIIKGDLFSKIKGIEIVDNTNCIVGVLDDLFVDDSYNIKAILISSGLLLNFIEGKRVALANDLKFKQKYIYLNKNIRETLISVPHGVSREIC